MKVLISLLILSLTLVSCSSSEKKVEPVKKAPAKKQQATKSMKPHHPTKHKEHSSIKHTKWSYKGLTGPEMWGDLEHKFSTCKTGTMQSPINLVWTKPKKAGSIQFHYKDSDYKLEDNGHTIKASFSPGSKIIIRGEEFELAQFHFHAHSEHSIANKFYPLEAHFVHKNKNGDLAVIGVLFVEGKSNPYLESMWQQFPKEKNRQIASSTSFNPLNLIPTTQTYYHYQGSLTSPPCSENVNWNVFNTPVELSKEQLTHFNVLYAKNYRPIQSTNKRAVTNF